MEEDTLVQTFTSEANEEHKPKVRQEFETIEGTHEFYNIYSSEVEFSARLFDSKKRPGTKIVI